jgi:hypothetical protein
MLSTMLRAGIVFAVLALAGCGGALEGELEAELEAAAGAAGAGGAGGEGGEAPVAAIRYAPGAAHGDVPVSEP